MFRLSVYRIIVKTATRHSSTLPKPPQLAELSTPEEMQTARTWIQAFEKLSPDAIPRDSLQISYSRSSGPGGQNVNKLSTKATVRLVIDSASWIPIYALRNLTHSSYHSSLPEPTGSILLSSSAHRTQPQNLADALSKLHAIVVAAAKQGLVGETSEKQKQRVNELVKREKGRTMQVKKQRKDVKSGRRSSGGDY